ncbi:family 1 glycosylhydrolase [Actinotalea sp. M2MS4P-6]|uniref:family 1 glycosylhydrolase n=1 Tax=Actinotalea sp. M2MS4P-6 TaxID=2983762 RepID=UPI0021E504C0|nr:family 1 glycosylhydrolase [Actinotalea sp. M2MS4P-6]MCV2394315.1 family 1 glycosylhydrolase [Actinotalea sp. M2MS4P-6]
MSARRRFEAGALTWVLGIEDTCVYPPGDGTVLDEHVLTQHDEHWREDLARAAELGATTLRYGASWPLVHRAPGAFDWAHLDDVVEAAEVLHLELVLDLVHYGCPPWLGGSFTDARFPAALAEFAGALAERYRGRVHHFTPLNEPLTTASFSGLRGIWPPHATGWRGWTAVTVAVALGVAAAERAIRRANPDAVVVHVEASALYETGEDCLRGEVELLQQVARLPLELALGRVGRRHPMAGWLVEHGADPHALDELARRPASPDILGVNYYPDLTPRDVVMHEGRATQIAVDRGAAGLESVLRGFAEDYGLPLVITETSIEGDDAVRTEWLRAAVESVARLRSAGLDLRGFTWWPLFDFVDWSYASGGQSVEEFLVPRSDGAGRTYAPLPPMAPAGSGPEAYLRRMGLLRLESDEGRLVRVPTAASELFRTLAVPR